jgi:hypothetical protein
MKLHEVVIDKRVDFTSRDVDAMMDIRDGTAKLDEPLFDKLYDIFVFSGDMPYEIAKARTGDPYEWIEKHIASMSPIDLKIFLKQHSKTAFR